MSGFDLVLAALIVGTGLFAVTVRDLFGAVVFFIVYGVFIALAWLRLGAMDVALTEAALGAGLTGVLLIGAVARLARRTGKDGTDALSRDGVASALSVSSIAAMLVSAAISLALGRAFLSLSPPDGLRASVDENLDASGVSNPVTAVLINFRGWDTLLESIVLLAALIGLWSLWRDDDWGRGPEFDSMRAPTACWRHSAGCCRLSGFCSACIWCGSARRCPAARSRAERCSRRCGC